MTVAKHTTTSPSPYAQAWALDPKVAMLNHGSFGACPRDVLEAQQRFRRQMEFEPVRFFLQEREPLLDAARRVLAQFVGAEAANIAFVRNVTEGVNSVLRSLRFGPGDELLITDHAYNACRNVVDFVASRNGAKVVLARVPLPIASSHQVVDAIAAYVTDRTRLAVIDHITSPTAVIFPIEELVRMLHARGVDTLVDGAHAPGMVSLNLERIGAAYYAGNCHKWLCAPKGAGFLCVRPDRQEGLHPALISHGFNSRRSHRCRLHDEFDWTGTGDPTPWLCVPEAIRFLDTLTGDGMEGVIRRNHDMAVEARQKLCQALGLSPLCPDEMLGAMATLSLPDDDTPVRDWIHPLQARLLDEFAIEVPIYHWPARPHLFFRISAQAYNSPAQYERLAEVLHGVLEAG